MIYSRYKITTIIGEKDGLGVENLQGSGMVAGETSRAYDEVCTISLVTCRSVGIGSYLVRLGQRVIQVDNSCIILTGANSLNNVLGRQVRENVTFTKERAERERMLLLLKKEQRERECYFY